MIRRSAPPLSNPRRSLARRSRRRSSSASCWRLVGVTVSRPAFGVAIKPLADAFLRMIKMIIAPLLFSTLVVGIAGTGDLKAMGRIGAEGDHLLRGRDDDRAVSRPRRSSTSSSRAPGWRCRSAADTSAAAAMAQNQQHAWDIFLHLFPTSVVDAMARGDILQLVVFSTFFGIALAAIGAEGQPVLDVLESTAQAMFKFTGYVMAFAPIGVFAAIAATVGGKGLGDPAHARQARRADVPRPRDLRR